MSDYTKTTNFTAKDNLTTGNALKVIKGSYFDTEFDNIATHIATKYDSGNLASQAEAEAGTNNVALMTPLRTEQWSAVWAAENSGVIGDLHALADPGGDRLMFWDDSAKVGKFLTIGNALGISGTTIGSDVATTSADGVAELATDAEVNTGSDTVRIVTPASLVQCTNLLQATATQRGAAEIATQAEVDTGTDTARYVTPETLAGTLIGAETAKVLKTSDETIDTDTTLSDDAALAGLIMATGSSHYYIECIFRMTSVAAADFKFRFVWSETPTEVAIQSVSCNTTAGHNVDAIDLPTGQFVHDTNGADSIMSVTGTFKTGATPGTITLQWAQNISDGGNTTVHAGSFMRITKLT